MNAEYIDEPTEEEHARFEAAYAAAYAAARPYDTTVLEDQHSFFAQLFGQAAGNMCTNEGVTVDAVAADIRRHRMADGMDDAAIRTIAEAAVAAAGNA